MMFRWPRPQGWHGCPACRFCVWGPCTKVEVTSMTATLSVYPAAESMRVGWQRPQGYV
jgi:hypothetical protein